MCGLVYFNNFKGYNVAGKVENQFYAQWNRGAQGFGYYIPSTNRLSHDTRERPLLRDMARHDASEIMFHHRMPTSTANVRNACHPFSSRGLKHNYVMIHNGYLSNDRELKREHDKLGLQYISQQASGDFNDSEALLYDIALYLEGRQDQLNAQGAMAWIMIERDATGKPLYLHYGRNYGEPLLRRDKKHILSLASEGKGKMIKPNVLYSFDYATGKTAEKPLVMAEYTWYNVPAYTVPVTQAPLYGRISEKYDIEVQLSDAEIENAIGKALADADFDVTTGKDNADTEVLVCYGLVTQKRRELAELDNSEDVNLWAETYEQLEQAIKELLLNEELYKFFSQEEAESEIANQSHRSPITQTV